MWRTRGYTLRSPRGPFRAVASFERLSMSTPLETGPGRLNGWKEIAAYLGKGSRTVQRWEKLYGLPVHRIGREGGEIVFAFRDEIERWASASRERAANADLAPGIREAEPAALEAERDAAQRLELPEAAPEVLYFQNGLSGHRSRPFRKRARNSSTLPNTPFGKSSTRTMRINPRKNIQLVVYAVM